MKKMQKIWLGIFLAMFIVPEILWSPVGNFIYQLYNTQFGNTRPFRVTFLDNPANINYLSSILFIQFFGILLTFIYLIFVRKNIANKGLFWAGLIFVFLLAVVSFFCFGLSVSLRHIGF